MLFFVGVILFFIITFVIIFFSNPKNEDENKSHLFEVESTNCCDDEDKRYKVLENANILGTYLKNKK